MEREKRIFKEMNEMNWNGPLIVLALDSLNINIFDIFMALKVHRM